MSESVRKRMMELACDLKVTIRILKRDWEVSWPDPESNGIEVKTAVGSSVLLPSGGSLMTAIVTVHPGRRWESPSVGFTNTKIHCLNIKALQRVLRLAADLEIAGALTLLANDALRYSYRKDPTHGWQSFPDE